LKIFAVGRSKLPLMLSRKCRYALEALKFMVENGKYFARVPEISASRKIPRKFLGNIMCCLKEGGLIGSKQGKGGGFYFTRSPDQITLLQIINVIDGPLAMLPCVGVKKACVSCEDYETCAVKEAFTKIRKSMERTLTDCTLKDAVSGRKHTALLHPSD